jgi:hypothetical protein
MSYITSDLIIQTAAVDYWIWLNSNQRLSEPTTGFRIKALSATQGELAVGNGNWNYDDVMYLHQLQTSSSFCQSRGRPEISVRYWVIASPNDAEAWGFGVHKSRLFVTTYFAAAQPIDCETTLHYLHSPFDRLELELNEVQRKSIVP